MTAKTALSRLISILAILAILTGCTNPTSPTDTTQPPPRWPAILSELHFVWTAEPGIDLATGPAVVVRAYQESFTAAAYGNSNDYLYPGFDHAVAPNQPVGSPRSTLSLWPELGHPLERPLVGTFQNHIIRVDQNAQHTAVVVCNWLWGAALQQPSGRYVRAPRNRTNPGIEVARVDLISSPMTTNLPPQNGPSNVAMTDVFGGWRVVGQLTETDSIGAGAEWPEFDQDMAACVARAPETAERRRYLTTGEHPRSDFPTLPASPGWPAESQ